MKVLYIGGTGEISYECVKLGAELGQQVTVFNRGNRSEPLPDSVEHITGDLGDDQTVKALADQHFDVVCQFIAFGMPRVEKDIELFSGKCGQYVFISSASAYQKPLLNHVITEQTPLVNPFWAYSRKKAAMEQRLMQAHEQGQLNVTNIRPSHTYRTRFGGTFVDGMHWAWRMRQGKPIIAHGDGQSLWTLTHSADFAKAFVHLLGNGKAAGEAFHITADFQYTWDRVFQIAGQTIGAEPDIVHVTSDKLVGYNADWAGPLYGDKTASVVFDNSKVRQAVGGSFECTIDLEEGYRRVWETGGRQKLDAFEPKPEIDQLIDRIIAEQV